MTSKIVRPLTNDGLFGYDELGQLWLHSQEGEYQVYSMAADVRHKTCSICNRGWEPNGPAIADQLHWQVTDDYIHESCLVRFVSLKDRCIVHQLFRTEACTIRTSDSRYWGGRDPWCKRLWYHIELKKHPYDFTIGMRKKVWSIELTKQGGQIDWYKSAENSFSAADVTKEFSPDGILLHAWGDTKLASYVDQLLGMLQ